MYNYYLNAECQSRSSHFVAIMRKKTVNTKSSLPKPGDAFLMPLADGRFGFCHIVDIPAKVLGKRNSGHVIVEASSWVGNSAPDLNDPQLRKTLIQTHHGWGPNTWRVFVRSPLPDTFQKLGTIPVRDTKPAAAIFTHWEALATEVLTEWRWRHDRLALLLEEQEAAIRSKAEHEQAAKQQQAALDQLTLTSLKKKLRFTSWKGDRPDKAIAACRKLFRDTVDGLISLGPKPKKRDVAKVVRNCVEELNSLDERYNGFIETGEREELCREIDELVYVAGLGGCNGLADRWRDW
jgi:hypothetical protein